MMIRSIANSFWLLSISESVKSLVKATTSLGIVICDLTQEMEEEEK